MSVSDKLIAISTMLFILSMISERVVTYIKLWCIKGRSFLFIIVPAEVDTCEKSDDPEEEAKRSRSILAINLTVGFLIALLAKASLFDMFSFSATTIEDDAWNKLFSWPMEKYSLSFEFAGRLLSILFGCMLTGSFISLGSKFWHDLLDLLLETKNLKRKLSDRQTYEFNTTKELDEYIATDYNELAKICLEQNKEKIELLPGVINYFIGMSSDPSKRRPVIMINSSLASGGNYPSSLPGKLDSGKTFSVPVEVIYGFDIPEVHFGGGNSICNSATAQVSGTICCGVQKNDKNYFLTCAHVLTGGLGTIDKDNADGWFTDAWQNDAKSSDIQFKPVGSWSYGIISSSLDIALVETGIEIDPIKKGNPVLAVYRPEMNHFEVFVNGNRNQKLGYVVGYLQKEIDFKYNGSIIKHSGLIMISGNKSAYPTAITEPGDSGALVYFTADSTPLGMVVGGNNQYTYIIPMQAILTVTKTNLI